MIEYGMLQLSALPALPFDVVTYAWAAVGGLVLLALWEVATFVAYMLGLREGEYRRRR